MIAKASNPSNYASSLIEPIHTFKKAQIGDETMTKSPCYFAPVDKSPIEPFPASTRGRCVYLVPLGIKLDQAAKKSAAGLAHATGIKRGRCAILRFCFSTRHELERDLVQWRHAK